MKSRIRIAELREQVEFYSLLTQNNATSMLPEVTTKYHGRYYAKIERGLEIVEGDGKRNTEEIWNAFIRTQNCRALNLEMRAKWYGRWLEILSIQEHDIHFTKITMKLIK